MQMEVLNCFDNKMQFVAVDLHDAERAIYSTLSFGLETKLNCMFIGQINVPKIN